MKNQTHSDLIPTISRFIEINLLSIETERLGEKKVTITCTINFKDEM